MPGARAAVVSGFKSELSAEVANKRLAVAEAALRNIARLRPAGDIATATDTRALVQKMEAIAVANLQMIEQIK